MYSCCCLSDCPTAALVVKLTYACCCLSACPTAALVAKLMYACCCLSACPTAALVAKLSAERDELVQEVARLRRVVEATGSLAGSHRRGAADGGSYKAGLKLAAAATASWKNEVGGRPASSTRTVAGAGANRKTGSHSGSAGTAPDNQLILDLNSEVSKLKWLLCLYGLLYLALCY